MAARREKLKKAGVWFSLLFGGGAPYSCGEDSLFLMDCLRKGLRIYKIPVEIGEEVYRPSTWFEGYHEKFFYDRGYLFQFLYGPLAYLFGFRFVYAKKSVICNEIKPKEAFRIVRKGIRDAKC